MKILSLYMLLVLSVCHVHAQHVAVAADKMNAFYLGFDNPVSITVENCPCNKLIVKTTKGDISGSDCKYIFKGANIGRTDIIIYRKDANKLKRLGTSSFRVKALPDPNFCIGPYSYSLCTADKKILAAQQYVRADYMNLDFDARASVDSFIVKVVKADSSATMVFHNSQNKLSEEIRAAFLGLEKDDIVVFDEIYVTGPDRRHIMIGFLSLKIAFE